MTNKWIFKYNPDQYLFFEAVNDPELENQDYWYYNTLDSIYAGESDPRKGARHIEIGDEFFIYQGTRNQGIVGRGHVVGSYDSGVEVAHCFQIIPESNRIYDRNLDLDILSAPQDTFLLNYDIVFKHNDVITKEMLAPLQLAYLGRRAVWNRHPTYTKMSQQQWDIIMENFPILQG